MSVFLRANHMVLRNPSGSDGNVEAMRAAGFGIVLCNVRDFAPDEWATIRDRAARAGVACGPWARTASGGQWDEAMLQALVAVADDWRSPLMVDSEKELDGSGDTLTRHIADVLGDRDYALSMECWPFGAVDWTPLADVPVCPQIFPAEVEIADDPEACRREWYRRGVHCVVFTFGSYAGMTPDQFDRLTPYGVYTADDCSGNYAAWKPLGSHEPCAYPEPEPEPEGDDVQPITDTQAREAIKTVAQGALSAYTDPKPRGRNTIAWRVANAEDDAWNRARDGVKAALDAAGVADVPA